MLLDLHPVTGSGLLDLVTLDCPSHVYSTTKEEELLGQGRLPSIGVTDDGEGSPLVYLCFVLVHLVSSLEQSLLRARGCTYGLA